MQGHFNVAEGQGAAAVRRMTGLFRWANLVLVDGDQILLDWEALEVEEGGGDPCQVLVRFQLLDGTSLALTTASACQARFEEEGHELSTQCAEGIDVKLRFYRLQAAPAPGKRGEGGRLAFATANDRAPA